MSYSPELLLDYLNRIDGILSRTIAKNEVDMSVSPLKRPMLVSGDELKSIQERNREMVASYIAWKARIPALSRTEMLAALLTIAEVTGLGIFPTRIFREWPYDSSQFGRSFAPDQLCDPDRIGDALEDLCSRMLTALSQHARSAVEIAASIEWELGIGPIHPFYDACGRISRCFSLLTILWLGESPRLHVSRDDYYRAGSLGLEGFVAYYKALPIWNSGKPVLCQADDLSV